MSSLMFDASNGLLDAIYRLRHFAAEHAAVKWSTDTASYDVLAQARRGDGSYLFEPVSSASHRSLLGLSIVIDDTISSDTIELRDKDDRIVGKVYNIR